MHFARFEVEDEIPFPEEPDSADEDDADEPKFLAQLHATKYKVTYTPVTTYDGDGIITEKHDLLKIDYDGADLCARSIFKPVRVNGARFIPAATFKIEDSKIIEPTGRKEIYVGELDELVVAGLRKIASPEIQDALGSYIMGYVDNNNGQQLPKE